MKRKDDSADPSRSGKKYPAVIGGRAARECVFDALKPLARGIAQTFGELCEVVIHDFSDPEHSIVWIEGNVTKRKIGGSVTEIGLAAVRGGDSQEDLIGYVRNTKDGKVLRSSTMMLRDSNNHVYGCICINLDITEVMGLRKALSLLAPEIDANAKPVRFTDEIEEVLSRIIQEALSENLKPLAAMNRSDRLSLIAALDRRGAFQIQRGVPTIGQLLGVSRPTIYTYLTEVRSGSGRSRRQRNSAGGSGSSGYQR
jgi:predicted transcriptional regulator YheO